MLCWCPRFRQALLHELGPGAGTTGRLVEGHACWGQEDSGWLATLPTTQDCQEGQGWPSPSGAHCATLACSVLARPARWAVWDSSPTGLSSAEVWSRWGLRGGWGQEGGC